ncbi:Trm112 family protein [soil metagenome]
MQIDSGLLAILACPSCRAPLRADQADPERTELVCTSCGLVYPVREDIPVLLVDEARRPEAD